jgi:hypothetical protein
MRMVRIILCSVIFFLLAAADLTLLWVLYEDLGTARQVQEAPARSNFVPCVVEVEGEG